MKLQTKMFSVYVLAILVRAPSAPTPVYCSTIRVIREWIKPAYKPEEGGR